MKTRKPLRRSTTPIPRHVRPRPVNRKRKAANWVRAYGSVERVLFVKTLPCVFVEDAERCAGEIHNHHTRNDGKSRKGPFACIVPLCTLHHIKLHAASGWLPAVDMEVAAACTVLAWEQYSGTSTELEQRVAPDGGNQ